MGLFDSLFGPSINDRVTPYFTEGNYPMHERILACVRDIAPTLEIGRQTDKFYEAVQNFVPVVGNDNEMISLFHASMFTFSPVSVMQRGLNARWEVIIISEVLAKENKQRLFGKYKSKGPNGYQMWLSLSDDGKPLSTIVESPDWERVL